MAIGNKYRPLTFPWNNLSQGSYSLTARATDNRGAQSSVGQHAVVRFDWVARFPPCRVWTCVMPGTPDSL